ncbi:CPBP family intramembrane glutamic endopeptidase [Oceanobacillus sp. CAU 1775]
MQLLFLLIAIILSVFLFDNFSDWKNYFHWDLGEIFYYGILAGLLIVAIDFILMFILPASAFDDGGINERIFRNQSVANIFLIALLVAISEELLFRGVIQTTFGYVFASILFAVIHFRYLKKIVLFLSVVFISLFIGYIFILIENLVVTIVIHFIVDFLLGLYIRFKK